MGNIYIKNGKPMGLPPGALTADGISYNGSNVKTALDKLNAEMVTNYLNSCDMITALNTDFNIAFNKSVSDHIVAFGGFVLVSANDPRFVGFVTSVGGNNTPGYFIASDPIAPDAQRISGLITMINGTTAKIKILTGNINSTRYLTINRAKVIV